MSWAGFFSDIGEKPANMQDDQNIVYLKVNHNDCSIFLYLAFHDEVLKDIKSFKT